MTIFHFFVYIKTLLGLQSLLQRIGTSLKNIVLKNSYMLKFRKKSVLQFFSVSPFFKKTIVLSWERTIVLHVEHKEAAVFTHQNLQLADNIAFLLYWVLQRGARCSNCPANV